MDDIDYFLMVGCTKSQSVEGPFLMVREEWPPWFMAGDALAEVSAYYELDGEPGRVEGWTLNMDTATSSVYHVPPPDIGTRIIDAMLTDKTRELFIWIDPDNEEQVVQMVFSAEGFLDVAAPVLEHCGTEEQLAQVK